MSLTQREQPSIQVAATGGVVLVVDDNIANRIVLREILRREGYRVLMAMDGDTAVEVFAVEHVDFVLMDVMMPGMDGYEATRRIKQMCVDDGRYCPVLFVTAMTDEQALVACMDCGGDGFLVKPYNGTILRSKMRALERTRDLYALVLQQKRELEEHHENLRHQHDIAERTFSKLMQAGSLDAPNLKHLLAPVGLASGDLLLAELRPDGVQQILLGDFTGHGLAAAMGAIPVADIFQSMTRKGFGIDVIAAEINRKLKDKLPVGLFLAGCLLTIDASTGRVCLWNGGIPEVLIRRAGAGIFKRLSSRHLPLGILDDSEFEADLDCAELQAGDCIYAYSDGLIEAVNPEGEMFGAARLEAVLDTAASVTPFTDICVALNDFRAGKFPHDDIALIEIECPEASVLPVAPTTPSSEGVTFSIDYDSQHLRQDDVQALLMRLLEMFPELDQSRGRLYTVITELFNNALDHGLLQLDSSLKRDAEGFVEYYMQRAERLRQLTQGHIHIALQLSGDAVAGQIMISVEDSGAGFDHAVCLRQAVPQALSRRGLALVKALCRHLEFHGSGNRVDALYVWPETSADA